MKLNIQHELKGTDKNIFILYIVASCAVLILMMIAGGTMRFSQAQLINVNSQFFYELLTVHGAGMVGISGLVTSSILWYFLRRYVNLSTKIFITNFVIFMTGVICILASIFIGKFAAAWTFLYPLPAISAGVWSKGAAVTFLLGLLIIGVGFLIFYLDVAWALIKKYGNLYKSLGAHYLFSKNTSRYVTPSDSYCSHNGSYRQYHWYTFWCCCFSCQYFKFNRPFNKTRSFIG